MLSWLLFRSASHKSRARAQPGNAASESERLFELRRRTSEEEEEFFSFNSEINSETDDDDDMLFALKREQQ